jgi:hypothetical protein
VAEEMKRKRGGQVGNRNAVKHGYYSKAFKQAERSDLDNAAGLEGVDAEITLIRHEIKKALSGKGKENLLLLIKAAVALEKLVRAHYRIKDSRKQDISEAIKNTYYEIVAPAGISPDDYFNHDGRFPKPGAD